MAIASIEELPRSVTHLLGESPDYTRTFEVVVTDGNQSATQVISACGALHGASHPEFSSAKCYSVETSEEVEADFVNEDGTTGRLVVNVIARYKIPTQQEDDPDPLSRPDIWKFSTQGVAVPALYYYDGNTLKPLTNSAGDYFEGLTVDEAQQKITITGNRAAFPSAIAAAVTNCVNESAYLGFAPDCVKVQGVSGELASEVVNDEVIYYWKVTAELLGRQTGWNLLIPDVGFNFIQGGQRKRATVKGPDGDDIASASPVALNGSGGMAGAGSLPSVLTRRVYKEVNFSTYFGTPPT